MSPLDPVWTVSVTARGTQPPILQGFRTGFTLFPTNSISPGQSPPRECLKLSLSCGATAPWVMGTSSWTFSRS